MSVFSFQFVIGALLLATVFFYLPGLFIRRLVLATCNVGFIWLCLPNYQSWIVLGAFVVSGYLVGVVLRRLPSSGILATYLLLLVAAFLVCKKYVVVQSLLPARVWDYPIVAIGLSYLLFRQIHFLVDMMQGQIDDVSFASYANYQLNLFGFLSGPIQRYQEFHQTWANWTPLLNSRHEILIAFVRLYAGLLKIAFSSVILWMFSHERDFFLSDPGLEARSVFAVLLKFSIMFYCYPIYLYFNFSGYCDVVIAAAALVGIQMPENFDRPYLSRNMIDFWTRWHRTLGLWIRDYVFMPMYKAVAERWSRQTAVLVFPCYFLAFFLAGVWHGSTLNFAVFGVLHGGGVAAAKLWEVQVVRRVGRKGLKHYLASSPIRAAAIFLTLNYFAFTLLFFPHDLSTTRIVLGHLFHRIGA